MPKTKAQWKDEPREEKVDWPEWDDALVERITDYLTTKYNTRRPPEVVAKVLALVIQLSQHHEPFPHRDDVRKYLNCNIYSVDGALSQSMARGLIDIRVEPSLSEAMNRSGRRVGVTKARYFTPTPAFYQAVMPTQSHRPVR